jgi:hypothetical protein
MHVLQLSSLSFTAKRRFRLLSEADANMPAWQMSLLAVVLWQPVG